MSKQPPFMDLPEAGQFSSADSLAMNGEQPIAL